MHREALRFGQACVSSPHYLASAAGLEVLADGGNALDAAVATNLTLGVVAPYLCGYGGDLFALVWDGRPHGYLGGGRAPGAATVERMRTGAEAEVMPEIGPLTVTVPGAVQGWFDLLERFGTRSFGRLARRALEYAREGFPLTGRGRLVYEFLRDRYRDFPEWQAVYGDVPERGVLVQPDLARTIAALGEDGPDAYYRGEIGDDIAEYVQRCGGLLSAPDLADYAGEWAEPLRASFRDVDVLELPPPTQGVTALEALRIVDGIGALPDDGIDRQHVLIEAMKLALADRNTHVSDPSAMRVDPEDLLADGWIADRAARIDEHSALDLAPGVEIPGGTAYLCAADGDGLLVSLIQTNFNEFGSGLTVPGWGINLTNRGRSFSLDQDHVNVVAPGKRTLHTLIPALALRDADPWLVFGTMGDDAQPQIHLQILVRLLEDGADLQEALDAPRWRIYPTDWRLLAETRFPDGVLDGLRARGHVVSEAGPYFDYLGYAHAIALDRRGYAAATDPRAEGAALGL